MRTCFLRCIDALAAPHENQKVFGARSRFEMILKMRLACTTVVMIVINVLSLQISVADEAGTPATKLHAATILSDPYLIDKKYKSMVGPKSKREFNLLDAAVPELLWIKSIEISIVDANNPDLEKPKFLTCHANVDFVSLNRHRMLMGWDGWASPRVFTLAQGQTEVYFPDGFGIPIRSDELLSASTQVLNAYDEFVGSEVRQRIIIRYIKESERTEEIRGLRLRFTQGLVSLEEAPQYFSMASHNHSEMVITGAGTEEMVQLNQGESAGYVIKNELGRKTAAHWIVSPGYDENHTVMNRLMGLDRDVEIHYIAGHMHPYASSIMIRDMTDDRVLFSTDIESSADKKVLTKIGNFSDAHDPILLRTDHDYELVTVYNNTTDGDVTAMAVLNMYVLDNDFDVSANVWRR